MTDYISREAVKDAICVACSIDSDYHKCDGYAENSDWCDYMVAIRAIPAADVRPVVRGRDICDTVDGHCEFKCSVCGVELSSVHGGNNDFGLDGGYFNFCPNCGARMDMREEQT